MYQSSLFSTLTWTVRVCPETTYLPRIQYSCIGVNPLSSRYFTINASNITHVSSKSAVTHKKFLNSQYITNTKRFENLVNTSPPFSTQNDPRCPSAPRNIPFSPGPPEKQCVTSFRHSRPSPLWSPLIYGSTLHTNPCPVPTLSMPTLSIVNFDCNCIHHLPLTSLAL